MATACLLVLPGALTAYAAFHAGGFFPGTPALLAVVLGILLTLRITLAAQPFAGFGRALALPAAALGLYSLWILLSAFWSDAPARALIEFDRSLLYLLALVLLGSLAGSRARVAWGARILALAFLVVCAAALASRLAPDLIEVAPRVAERRLSFPLTYWNALGLIAALGLVLSVHFAASEREPPFVRVLGAASLPVLACTLYFTFSRGAIVVAVLGLLLYVVAARPRSLVVAVLAAAPAVAVALIAALGADRLAGDEPTTAAAAEQGHDVALVVVACIVGAGVLRALLLPLDRRLAAVRMDAARSPRVLAGAAAVALVAVVVAGIALDGPGRLGDVVDGFRDVEDSSNSLGSNSEDLRGRLFEPGNNGRIEQWKVAFGAFEDNPVTGLGAGKFSQTWALERTGGLKVEDAHSLYLESLAELGFIGFALLAIAVGALLVGFALRSRGEERHLHAALLAAGVAWAIHAGVDWDWEMPAVTVWLFAMGGLALAQRPGPVAPREPGRFTRVALGVGVLALMLPAALVGLSQRELDKSVGALARGDCGTAIDSALASTRWLSVRPEPFMVLGYCDVRVGRPQLAVTMAEAAVSRDPEWWEPYYSLALVQGFAGIDPRPAARRALELNPKEDLARDVVRRFRTDDPEKWQRRAGAARLPLL